MIQIEDFRVNDPVIDFLVVNVYKIFDDVH